MDKDERIYSANETINLMKKDGYKSNSVLVDSSCVTGSFENFDTKIFVQNENVINRIFTACKSSKHVGVLNFASAKNPGGGFQYGANAQEEALCRVSYLYGELIKFKQSYYSENQKNANRYLYSDKLIYSHKVKFIKNVQTNGAREFITDPVFCDVITIAAPNKSVNSKNSVKVTEREYTIDLVNKLTKVLREFKRNDCKDLILGAFGCGVFGNDPKKVARIFDLLLQSNEFYGEFREVIFSIYGKGPNLTAFRKEFND